MNNETTYPPTAQQQVAVDSEAKRRVITAHPGTGKTFTIVEIMDDYVNSRGRSPDCITAVHSLDQLRPSFAIVLRNASAGVAPRTYTSAPPLLSRWTSFVIVIGRLVCPRRSASMMSKINMT